MTACQFLNDERMTADPSSLKQPFEPAIAVTEMVNPYGGVNEHQGLSGSSPAAGYGSKGFFSAAQPCQTLGALQGDQRLQTGMDQGGLFSDA